MVIVKARDKVENWVVYHRGVASDAETDYLQLDTTIAASDNSGVWNDTAPTSTVFTVGSDSGVNGSTYNYVAYCFANVLGFSLMSSYVGNGSADGPFVYTGFRPAFVLIKRSSATEDWAVFDSTRNPSNLTNLLLSPNLSSAETTVTGNPIDILSNGFKLRGTGNTVNASGSTYIYACFAENPFKLALAR
jgi:hypothetical protein